MFICRSPEHRKYSKMIVNFLQPLPQLRVKRYFPKGVVKIYGNTGPGNMERGHASFSILYGTGSAPNFWFDETGPCLIFKNVLNGVTHRFGIDDIRGHHLISRQNVIGQWPILP